MNLSGFGTKLFYFALESDFRVTLERLMLNGHALPIAMKICNMAQTLAEAFEIKNLLVGMSDFT